MYKKTRCKTLLGVVAVCCFAAMATNVWAVDVGQQPSAFESRAIDTVPNPGGDWSAEHSLARAANGTLYAVYGGKALYMATKGPSDTAWTVQTVDPSYRVGKHNSLALDSNGYPHISYATFSENVALKYARWDGSAWQIEYVDGESIINYAGCNNAIALDSNDQPHIAYAGGKLFPSGEKVRNLKYAYYDGSAWQIATVDADVHLSPSAGRSPLSLAVDSTNTPHISYFVDERRNATDDGWIDPEELMYATKSGGTWDTAYVDADGDVDGRWNSIAVDSNNVPHISYFDETNEDLRYATLTGAVWNNILIDSQAYRPNSIAIGPNDYPQIGYYDRDFDDAVMLASFDGAIWNTSAVFDPNYTVNDHIYVYSISIVVDNSNQAYFLFNDTHHGCKVYSTTWDGSAWQTELVDLGGNLAHRNDIATDKKGFSHVSYRRSGYQRFDDTGIRIEFSDLMYARWDGKEWVTQVVDGIGDISAIPAEYRILNILMSIPRASTMQLPLTPKAIPISVILRVFNTMILMRQLMDIKTALNMPTGMVQPG